MVCETDPGECVTAKVLNTQRTDKDTDFNELKESLPEHTRFLHTGSLAITPSQLPKIQELFKLAQKRDILISVDVNIRSRASIERAPHPG